MKCLTKYSRVSETSQTCHVWQNLCFKKWQKGKKVSRGCTATCPKPKKDEVIQCCAKDKCNK
uniref:Neurotoxin-like protein 1 n=1 Tax=Causus rhombeatus TaxID=44735 RepID=3SO3_CAURH|nr:RecName: Full=Neurotoxin-like protein 1 [Causus rhombeatus]